MAGLLQEFLRSPRSIGAVAPSSGALAEAMLSPLDLPRRSSVLELGPGTGALTGHIAARLGPWHRYLGVEINGSFVSALQQKFPALDFAHASVEDLDRVLRERNWHHIDAVISALPWASLPQTLQDRVFSALGHHHGPGAGFATFAYVQGLMLPGGKALRRRMADEFTRVERSPIVWRNLPPAIVYIGRW